MTSRCRSMSPKEGQCQGHRALALFSAIGILRLFFSSAVYMSISYTVRFGISVSAAAHMRSCVSQCAGLHVALIRV